MGVIDFAANPLGASFAIGAGVVVFVWGVVSICRRYPGVCAIAAIAAVIIAMFTLGGCAHTPEEFSSERTTKKTTQLDANGNGTVEQTETFHSKGTPPISAAPGGGTTFYSSGAIANRNGFVQWQSGPAPGFGGGRCRNSNGWWVPC